LKEISLFLLVFCIIILSTDNFSFSEANNINLDENSYKKSDVISISGIISDPSQNAGFITIKDSNGNNVWNEKILIDDDGNFSISVIAGTPGWIKSGTYEVLLESGKVIDSATFFYDSGPQVNPPSVIDEFYVSHEDLILIFAIAITIVIGIFVYLARNIILRKKTKYDETELDSKKNRDYEKYHSDWTEEEIFGDRKTNSINEKELNEMLKNKTLPNYYEILELTQSATYTEIKNKFRLLAKEWHPDKRKDSSEEKMAEINRAYEVLSDEKFREQYDKYFKFL
jgi:molecular chaperone DnaJ